MSVPSCAGTSVWSAYLWFVLAYSSPQSFLGFFCCFFKSHRLTEGQFGIRKWQDTHHCQSGVYSYRFCWPNCLLVLKAIGMTPAPKCLCNHMLSSIQIICNDSTASVGFRHYWIKTPCCDPFSKRCEVALQTQFSCMPRCFVSKGITVAYAAGDL